MVAKIKLEAVDATGPAFKSAIDNATNAEKSIGSVANSMETMGEAGVSLTGTLSQIDASSESTAKALNEVETATAKMTARSRDADDKLNSLKERFIDAKKELDALESANYRAAAAAGKTAHGIDNLGDEAKESSAQIDRMKASLDRTSSSGGSFIESMAKVFALKEGFAKLVQGIDFLAERGSPAFIELRDSGKKLLEALIEITEQKDVQRFVEALAVAFSDTATFIAENSHYVGELIQTVREYFEVAVEGFTRMQEAVGLVAEGTTEELRNIKKLEEAERARADRTYEARVAAAEAQKQKAAADKIEADLIKAQSNAEELDAAKKIENALELEQLQAGELDRIRKLAEEGKLSAEEQRDSERRLSAWEARKQEIFKQEQDAKKKAQQDELNAAEEIRKLQENAAERSGRISTEEAYYRKSESDRLKQLIREEEEAQKAADKAREKAEAEAAKAMEAAIKKEADAKEKAEAKAAEAAKKIADGKLEEFRSYVEKLQGVVDQTKTPDGSELTGQMKQAVSGKNLLRGVIDSRQDAAEEEIRKQAEKTGRNQNSKDYQEEVAKKRKEVKSETIKEFKNGDISADELGKVQGQMAEAIISQGEKSGNLGKTAAAALRASAKAMTKQNAELEQQAQDIEEIRNYMESLANVGQRRQAQRKVR